MRWTSMTMCSVLLAAAACTGDPPAHAPVPMSRVQTDRTYLRDSQGRYVMIHGVNVSGSTKLPMTVAGKTVPREKFGETHVNGLPSYVGRPWPADQVEAGVKALRLMGFSAFRLLVNWEGIEPCRKGQYDQEYLKSIRTVVETANRYGVRVLLDMHQDAFSRHLAVRYNEHPTYKDADGKVVTPPRGSIEATILSLLPPYTDVVRGEGAPRWAVEACLQEKEIGSPNWGTPRLLSGLDQGMGAIDLAKLGDLLGRLMGKGSGETVEIPPWALYLKSNLPESFPVTQTTDVLPFTNWGIMAALSMDVTRCFLCLLAGDKAFPALMVTECLDPPPAQIDAASCNPAGAPKPAPACSKTREVSVKEYLQDAYANAWKQVVLQVRDLPNVLGYDIINEPNSNVIGISAIAGLLATGSLDGARNMVLDLMGPEYGETVFQLLLALRILPPLPDPPAKDATAEEKKKHEADRAKILHDWGMDGMDLGAILGMNWGFDRNFMKPFYERVGAEIVKLDPDAVVFIEPSMNAISLFAGGLGGWLDVSMTRPEGLSQVVYAAHNYADIYPFLGFNEAPRSFTEEEVRFRDYQPQIEGALALAHHSLGNIPAVLGEFGTYYNFSGIEASDKAGYRVSAQILDNYYEALERMFASRMLWCYTPDNDKNYGDLWNKEDFSIQGYEEKDATGKVTHPRQWRAERAWSRPHAMALAGKPISTHFWSPFHYFDPDKGVKDPEREFEVRYGGKETSAPTEIFVPEVHYPDGFYVWISDGFCYYDHSTRTLFHYPSNDEPGAVHSVRLLPPLPHVENKGWHYFFKGNQVLTGD